MALQAQGSLPRRVRLFTIDQDRVSPIGEIFHTAGYGDVKRICEVYFAGMAEVPNYRMLEKAHLEQACLVPNDRDTPTRGWGFCKTHVNKELTMVWVYIIENGQVIGRMPVKK